ncbi:hypothetical protein DXG03_006479 [Asterophora parasitica]|uniref:Uncharacterized protein n=1 Tax=Asterophora parasitica TaxID=117018 RepID=A0A9P7FYM8_9AGAR|nr:hypothetical protein DXG03_006479 [Asterophora parasitica]
MSKRRTPSAEIFKAIITLEELENDLPLAEETDDRATKLISEKIHDLLAILRRKAEPSLSTYSSSSFNSNFIDFDTLDEKFHIVPGELLLSQPNHAERAAAESSAQGGEVYMSSGAMYRHLDMLENLVPKRNEAGARLWIDTIFFRVSAMLAPKGQMVLNVEHHVPPARIPVVPGQTRPSVNIGGAIDYVALTTEPHKHELFLRNSLFQFVKHQNTWNGLFVTQAKQEGVPLVHQIAQAVAEMYASATYPKYESEKSIIRGALTNGHEWIFSILYLNEDDDSQGGTYAESPTIKIQVSDDYPYHVLPPGPDVVAGILAYWMERSFVDLDENDWFCRSRKSG